MIGQIVEVDGRKQWVDVEGAGSPPVVLEAGIGDVGLTWGLVQPLVARMTTVFAYDRPGMGRSDRIEAGRALDTTVEALRSTLAVVGLSPPYLLVGHSFASLLVRGFAALHPDEVAGLVLVDGSHEDQMERFPEELGASGMLPALAAQLREMSAALKRGEDIPELSAVPGSFPPPLAAEYRDATRPTASRLEAAAEEYESLPAVQNRLRELVHSVSASLPLIAIRHGVPQPMPGVSDAVNEAYEATWVTLQEELASRSANGEVRIAEGAGHLIHHEAPKLVAAAIEDVVARCRRRT